MAASPVKPPQKPSMSAARKASHARASGGDFDVAAWAGSAVRTEALPELRSALQKAQQREDSWEFVGPPMSREEVQTHYPKRKGIFGSNKEPWGKQALTAKDDQAVLFNFRAVHCLDEESNEDFIVELGDCILTDSSEFYRTDGKNIKQLMRVIEIFMTTDGKRQIRGQWFYQQIDTAMACTVQKKAKGQSKEEAAKVGRLFMPVPVGAIDERRLWLATVEDNETYPVIYELNCIDKKVRVLHVPPSKCVQTVHADYNPETDYWFDQVHTRRCITNEDCYEDWSPFSDRYKALEAEKGLEGIKELLQESPTGMIRGRNGGKDYQLQQMREINILDIFAGAGGLSHLVDAQDELTRMVATWACDWNESACATYTANHKGAHAFHYGLDQFVMLLIMWYKLEEAIADIQAGDESEEEEDEEAEEHGKVVKVLDVRLCEDAPKHTKGASKGQLVEALKEEQCWLELQVQRERRQTPAWEKLTAALTASAHLHAFVARTNAAKRIPHPGDVQLIAGGPPCQGVSGLNRHAAQDDVLRDPRNRLVHAYLELVDLLQPNYILMEQVTDVFRKEDGIYARFTVCQLVRHGYQTRVGQLTAGNYGCAQGRRRVFFWGARSGLEQLPAHPRPTHRCKDFNTGVGANSLQCHVDFEDEAQRAAAHPMVLMGDVLSDLPPRHNFSMAERLQYATEPTTLTQKWLRRPPPAGTPTLQERSDAADARMGASAQQYLQSIQELKELGGPELVGRSIFCRKDPSSKGSAQGKNNFAAETWNAHLNKELGTAADGETTLPSGSSGSRDGSAGAFSTLTREVERHNLAVLLGAVVLKEREEALVAQGPVRDHRPLMCNADDYMRMASVPHEKGANYRDLPGTVTNVDGTGCGGHWHAARRYNKSGLYSSDCGGGGMEAPPKASNNKTSRVDNYGATEAGAWRGTMLEGCESRTAWLPTGDLLDPRWCITYKNGKSNGRHGCYGRVWYDDIQSTVVTRAEPHNLQVVHPDQDRVLTVRENARCQGFPDYHVLVGVEGANRNGHGCGGVSVEQRYLQMGNAVAPPVALMLGHCLRLASQGQSPVAEPVIAIRDAKFEACMEEGRAEGLFAYSEKHKVAEVEKGFYWRRHRPDAAQELVDTIIEDDEEEPPPINDDGDDGADDDDEDGDDGGRPSGSGSRGAGGSGGNKRQSSGAAGAKAKRAKANPSGKRAAGAGAAAAGGALAAAGGARKRAKAAPKASKAAVPLLPPRAPANTSRRPSRGAAEAAKEAIWRSALTDTQLAALQAGDAAEAEQGASAGVAAGTAAGGGAGGVSGDVVVLDVTDEDVASDADQDEVEQDEVDMEELDVGGGAGFMGQPAASALAALCVYGAEDDDEAELAATSDVSMAEAEEGVDEEQQQEEHEDEEDEEEEEEEGGSPILELGDLVSDEEV